MKFYRILTSVVLFSVAVLFTPAIAEATCTIYEHRDFGGAKLKLYDGDRVIMTEGESIGMTENGHGGGYRIRYRPAWNDAVSSFSVTNGCRIHLWEHVDEKGMWWKTYESYSFVGGKWNDEVSEVLCTCPG